MDYLSSDKIGIVDLGSSEVSDEPLDEELVKEYIGGAAITQLLYEKYKDDDPIVLGTGLLTGTMVPGAALGVVTARSPLTGKVVHTPLTMYAGMELKYCGFDYLVIKGRAESPVYLWVHDGIADVEDAGALWGKDTWASTDEVRRLMGDDVIQVIGIGEAGEAKREVAQLTCNYWGTADRWGMGKLFGEKNLKLVAIRGMGLIEIADPEGFVERAMTLIKELRESKFYGKQGVGDLLEAMGHGDCNNWLKGFVHRHKSCFNTPIPTNSFLFLDEDPKILKESEKQEPGFLISDPMALAAYKDLGFSANEAGQAMKGCAKLGIDPYLACVVAQEKGIKTLGDMLESLPQMNAAPDLTYTEDVFSPWCPKLPLFEDFDIGSGENELLRWWNRRQATAYIFGIHPILAIASKEPSEEKLLEFASLGTEMEFSPDVINKVLSRLQQQ